MPMYERDDVDGVRVIDRWENGIGWLAHPEEDGKRATRFADRTVASGSLTHSTHRAWTTSSRTSVRWWE
jgi:hypothetical protein